MITKRHFDTYDGREVSAYTLTDGHVTAEVLDYGGIVRSLSVMTCGGLVNAVLGFDSVSGYVNSDFYCGGTIGRCANRIEGGRFSLGGKKYSLEKNNGGNHHHGGYTGFNKRFYDGEICGDTLRLTLKSRDGDQGYPGNLDFTVEFSVTGGALIIKFTGTSDSDTLFAPTSHAYFNLTGRGDILPTVLQINADYYLPLNGGIVPAGEIVPVEGTPFDFRQPKAIGRDIDTHNVQLEKGSGYDHNFCVSGSLDYPSATAWAADIRLDCYSDMPGLQFYSGNSIPSIDGRIFPRSAFCLEPQFYPNAINIDGFEKPILRRGECKTYTVKYKLSKNSP